MLTSSRSVMITESRFSWRKRARAFRYAWQGLAALMRYEHNARIHAVAAVAAVGAGVWLRISPLEWCVVVISIAAVVAAEALNSGLEALADRITVEHDPLVGRAKDYGAAAVTLLAFAALVVGAIIFIPKIFSLL